MSDFERMPKSVDAERAVLGAALLDPGRVLNLCSEWLEADAFTDARCRTLYQTLVAMTEDTRIIDIITVNDRLAREGNLETAGGSRFVEDLVDNTPTPAHVEHYIKIVYEKALGRKVIIDSRQVSERIFRGDDPESVIHEYQNSLVNLVPEREQAETNDEVMARSIERWEQAKYDEHPAIGLETPWEPVTSLLCGLEPGLTLVAARPSMGKTTFEQNLVDHALMLGHAVARWTLDSKRDELLERHICARACVSLPKLKYGFATEKQLDQVREARAYHAALPNFINDTSLDLAQGLSWFRMMKMKHDIRLMTVDFIQLIRVSSMKSAQYDANARVSMISSALKALSFELGVPMVALSQLSRPPKDRANRPPELADLRDSGTLEQDAHKVIMLHKDPVMTDKLKGPTREEKSAGVELNREQLKYRDEYKKLRAIYCDVKKNKGAHPGAWPMWLYPHYFTFHAADENFADVGNHLTRSFEKDRPDDDHFSILPDFSSDEKSS